MSIRWSPVAFSVLYCIGYVVAYVRNLPLALYYPQSRHWIWGPTPNPHEPGPAMAWYGVMASAILFAAIGAAVVRERWVTATLRNWLWVWPYAAIAVCIYMLRPYFT